MVHCSHSLPLENRRFSFQVSSTMPASFESFHSQLWPGQSPFGTSSSLQCTCAQFFLPGFLSPLCWLPNSSVLHLKEGNRENPLGFTSEILLCFSFLPFCHQPISCLHLSSCWTKQTWEKLKVFLSLLQKWPVELHLTTGQVLPACILLFDRSLHVSSGNHFLFYVLFTSCMNYRCSLEWRTMGWNEENFELEARQIAVSILLVCKLSVCVIFRCHLTLVRLNFSIYKTMYTCPYWVSKSHQKTLPQRFLLSLVSLNLCFN